MSALLLMAGAFAAVILVGCGAVYLHDRLEGARAERAQGGGGRVPARAWRLQRPSPASPAAGKVVWLGEVDRRVVRVASDRGDERRNPHLGRRGGGR